MTKYIVTWRTITSECQEVCRSKEQALRLAEQVKWEAMDGVTIKPERKQSDD